MWIFLNEPWESVSESATLRKEWIAPAFHHLVDAVRGSRGGGEDETAMTTTTTTTTTTTDDAAEYEKRVRAAAEAAVAGALTEAGPSIHTTRVFRST